MDRTAAGTGLQECSEPGTPGLLLTAMGRYSVLLTDGMPEGCPGEPQVTFYGV